SHSMHDLGGGWKDLTYEGLVYEGHLCFKCGQRVQLYRDGTVEDGLYVVLDMTPTGYSLMRFGDFEVDEGVVAADIAPCGSFRQECLSRRVDIETAKLANFFICALLENAREIAKSRQPTAASRAALEMNPAIEL
ncbi:hypothetical protein FOZ63_029744, partial [Perkinsus olseni]